MIRLLERRRADINLWSEYEGEVHFARGKQGYTYTGFYIKHNQYANY